jgi:isopenicillin N synthase-like dioxygenase
VNLFKAMAVMNIEEAARAIPVIDCAHAFRGGPGGLEGVARQVRRASEEVGFFYLAGHGVAPAVVDAAFEASREFHALPPSEKMRLALNDNNIGYLAPNQSIQGA